MELKLWENVHQLLCAMCHMSGVTCRISRVTCKMSYITWHHYSKTVRARELNFWDNVHHPLFVRCCVSQNIYTKKMEEPVVGGSVINGEHPDWFSDIFIHYTKWPFSSKSLNIIYSKTIRTRELKFIENVYPPLNVTCDVSCVTCHESCVTCQLIFLFRQRGMR